MSSPALYSELEGKRIFITGGTGIFGKWILKELENARCNLYLLTRNTDLFRDSLPISQRDNLTLIKGDICSFEYPKGVFDYIIHAATPVVSDHLDDDSLSAVIVNGTNRVLDFAVQCNCKTLLYISSGAVYGKQPTDLDRIPETYPCNPVSAYGRGKLIAENLCLNSAVNSVIARCFSFVGQGIPVDAHFAIGNFIGNCLKNETIVIKGDGRPMRSYMHSSDLVEWLTILLTRGEVGGIYNVGSHHPISIADLAKKIRSLALSDNQIQVSNPVDENTEAERYIPCNRKAALTLSLQLKVDLDTAILRTLKTVSS